MAAIFPTGWKRKTALTIDHTLVTGDLTNFVVNLIWNGSTGNAPAELYNAGAKSPMSDGRDIRFSSDALGEVQLPFEIVTFSPNSTVASARVKICVKLSSVSSATDTVFYIWYGNNEATALTAADSYGSNNVWTNGFLGVWHLEESSGSTATNSVTAGSNDGTYTGTTFPNQVDTAYGYMQNFVNANGNYVSIGTGTPWNITDNITLSVICTVTSYTAAWQALIAKGDFTYRLGRNNTSNGITFDRSITGGGFTAATNTTVITSGYHHVAAVFNTAVGSYAYTDGAAGALQSSLVTTLSDTKNLCIGRNADQTSRDWNGYIGDVKLSSVARSASWVAAEYNTTINFATFITASAPGDGLFPDTWHRKVQLSVDHTKVPADKAPFPIPVIWNGSSGNIPAEIYNDSALSPMSDGRDIRFTSDEAGKTMLPFEIVKFSPNSTVANARVEIWVKLPSISSVTNTTFYMWYHSCNATALTVDDVNGRNAAWAGTFNTAVYHMDGTGDVVDSTGNGYTMVNHGTTSVEMPLGTARKFDGAVPQYLQAATLYGNPSSLAISCLISATAVDSTAGTIMTLGDYAALVLTSSGQAQAFYYRGGSVWNNTTNAAAGDLRNVGTRFLAYTCQPSSTIERLYVSATYVSSTYTSAIVYTGLGSSSYMGIHGNGGTTFDYTGAIDEVWVVANNVRTPEWLTIEYNSKVGFATFFSAAAIEEVIGIRYDSQASVGVSATAAASVSHTLGNGVNRIVVATVSYKAGVAPPSVSSVKYNGVAMTFLDSKTDGNTSATTTSMWYMLDNNLPNAGGAYTLSATLSSAATGIVLGCVSLWNVAQRNLVTTYKSATTSATSLATPYSSWYDASWAIDGGAASLGISTKSAPDAPVSLAYRTNIGTIVKGYMGYRSLANAGAYTDNWTFTVATGVAQIVVPIPPYLAAADIYSSDRVFNRGFNIGIQRGLANNF